jgi:transposase
MNYKDYVGIDVSQKTLDVVLRSTGKHMRVANNEAGMTKMLKRLAVAGTSQGGALFCFEHTGIFSLPLRLFLAGRGILHVQVSSLAAKRSMGLKRGKTDKVDAAALADYAYRFREDLQPAPPPNRVLIEAKRFFSLREQLVRDRSGLMSRLCVEERMLKVNSKDLAVRIQQKVIRQLTQEIDRVEKEINRLIVSDPELKRNHDLVTSVKGVGDQTATYLLITTENFTLFKDWRKYACYAGIAPFENSSGTSIRGNTKVSQLANKCSKKLLGNCAASAIQCNPELKAYYQRRLDQGKHKMSTLNIVRNKILSRAFAVVHRQQPYVDLYKFAA